MRVIRALFFYTICYYILIYNMLIGSICIFFCSKYVSKFHFKYILLFLTLTLNIFAINFYKPIEVDTIEVVVENKLEYGDGYCSFETTYKNDYYVIYLYGDDIYLEYGDIIMMNEYTLSSISNKYNNISSFDYEKYMLGYEIKYSISTSHYDVIAHQSSFRYWLKNIRQQNISYNETNVDNYEYINALVYGENQFDTEKYDTFSELNIIHALTISGSHLVLIILFIRCFLSILNITKKHTNFILLIILPIYTILAGGAIPIYRACLLELIVIIFGNKINRIHASMLIFVYFCIQNPYVIFLVSFQLTFIISFLLYYIDAMVTSKKKFIQAIQLSFWISYFITPITLNLNYEINFLAPVANILLVPFISFIILPLCFLVEFSPFFTELFSLLLNITIYLFEYICNLFAIFTITTGNVGIIFSFIMLLLGFLYATTQSKKYVFLVFTCLLLLPVNLNIIGSVTFIDVGQGDSVLIQLPINKGVVLIDTGPIESQNEIETLLKYHGIRTIDIMFLTHNHSDHTGNAVFLTNNFNVKNIYGPISDSSNPNITELSSGDSISFKGYTFDILYPITISENENSNSLVIQTTLGVQTYLFTGDIEIKDEVSLLEIYDVQSTILKVPHHGSSTSSSVEFIESVAPNVCVISVGEPNMYGHPTEETIDTLVEHCEIMKTSEYGSITFYFMSRGRQFF